jgi:hypothetical protein
MFVDHQLLQRVVNSILIPNEKGQEFLQRSDRHTRRQGDRFNALAFQIGHQAGEVTMPVVKGRLAGEERAKPLQ